MRCFTFAQLDRGVGWKGGLPMFRPRVPLQDVRGVDGLQLIVGCEEHYTGHATSNIGSQLIDGFYPNRGNFKWCYAAVGVKLIAGEAVYLSLGVVPWHE